MWTWEFSSSSPSTGLGFRGLGCRVQGLGFGVSSTGSDLGV